MDDLKTEINAYLFIEFGVEGDESKVSGDWPFELETLLEGPDLTVFAFQADEACFALADESLNFLPQAGMTVDDLLLQRSGASWIGARDPVDLSEVRLGDPAVPSTVERRRRLEALGADAFPAETVRILEGLFLRTEQRYLALFGRSVTEEAAITGLPETPPIPVPFPLASAWRRLAWGVGHWLKQQNQTG
jgi:hypothetical protein